MSFISLLLQRLSPSTSSFSMACQWRSLSSPVHKRWIWSALIDNALGYMHFTWTQVTHPLSFFFSDFLKDSAEESSGLHSEWPFHPSHCFPIRTFFFFLRLLLPWTPAPSFPQKFWRFLSWTISIKLSSSFAHPLWQISGPLLSSRRFLSACLFVSSFKLLPPPAPPSPSHPTPFLCPQMDLFIASLYLHGFFMMNEIRNEWTVKLISLSLSLSSHCPYLILLSPCTP